MRYRRPGATPAPPTGPTPARTLEHVLQSIDEAVITTDARGVVTRLSVVAEAITGWPRDEALGRAIGEVLVVEDAPTADATFRALVRDATAAGPPAERALRTRDGRRVVIAPRCTAVQDRRGEVLGLIVAFRDVTRQRLVEQQLRDGEGLYTTGRLAATAVSDLDPLLTAIAAAATALTRELAEQSAPYERAARIREAAARATGLAHQLQTFSRRRAAAHAPLDVDAAVTAACELCVTTLPGTTELRPRLAADGATCVGDAARIEQAVLHLLLDARDAAPPCGTIRVGTTLVTLDEAACALLGHEVAPGPYAEVSIGDDGDLGARGPGLAAVRAIVTDHRGALHVDAQPGRGTVARLFLPLADVPARAAQPPVWSPRVTARFARVDLDAIA